MIIIKMKKVEKNDNNKNEEIVHNISNNNIEQISGTLPQIKEKEINKEKTLDKNEIIINNNKTNNNEIKEINNIPKDIEKSKVVIKIDKNEIQNLNIRNTNKLEEEKKNELKVKEK